MQREALLVALVGVECRPDRATAVARRPCDDSREVAGGLFWSEPEAKQAARLVREGDPQAAVESRLQGLQTSRHRGRIRDLNTESLFGQLSESQRRPIE